MNASVVAISIIYQISIWSLFHHYSMAILDFYRSDVIYITKRSNFFFFEKHFIETL